jgi:hypothetical protein
LDPTLLSTLISAGISLLSFLIYHNTIAKPATPTPTPIPAPAPAAPSADPFMGLPGLTGHPVLNVILPWLSTLLANSTAPTKVPSAADNAQNQAAISALANLIQADRGSQQQMQALLSNPPPAKAA